MSRTIRPLKSKIAWASCVLAFVGIALLGHHLSGPRASHGKPLSERLEVGNSKAWHNLASLPADLSVDPVSINDIEKMGATESEWADILAIAKDSSVDRAIRHCAFNKLRVRRDRNTATALIHIIMDEDETAIFRSWAMQHVGLYWGAMSAAENGESVALCYSIVDNSKKYPDLLVRETLWAMAENPSQCFDWRIESFIEHALGNDSFPYQDMLIRLSVRCRVVYKYADRISQLASSKDHPTSNAASHALRAISDG